MRRDLARRFSPVGAALLLPLALSLEAHAGDARLAALVAALEKPENFHQAYRLVDEGPRAVPELVAALGGPTRRDERIELCLREIARTKEGAKAVIERLAAAGSALKRARLARALAAAGAAEAVYPIVDALDSPQEPLDVSIFGPHGETPRETVRVPHPVSVAAATFGERAAAAILKRLPQRTSPLFRIEAAWGLGSVKSKAAVPELATIAANEALTSDERRAALGALAAIGASGARDAFGAALLSPDPALRRAGARGLAALPDPSQLPALAKLVEEDPEDEVRLEAVRALAALEDPLGAGALKAALDRARSGAAPRPGGEAPTSPGGVSEALRSPLAQAAIAGLGASGDPNAPAVLVEALEAGLGLAVEQAAARALFRIASLGIAPRERLRELAAQPTTNAPTARVAAAWVLAGRGEEDALKVLLESAAAKAAATRAALATLLGEGKLDGSVPVLEKLAADESPLVRRAAVTALGKHEAQAAGPALARAARHLDPDGTVRRLYAQAFGDALTQGTLDAAQQARGRALLMEAFEKVEEPPSLSERQAQAIALARLGERAGLLRVASAALASAEVPLEARRAALEALSRLPRQEATEATLEALVRDPIVGDDAALALARIRRETFFEPRWRTLLAPEASYR